MERFEIAPGLVVRVVPEMEDRWALVTKEDIQRALQAQGDQSANLVESVVNGEVVERGPMADRIGEMSARGQKEQ